MLIIGHRGAAGLAPENSLDALRAGRSAGADILEFDVRLTRDKVPVIIHDRDTLRTHQQKVVIADVTLDELRSRELAPPIMTLDELLDNFFGKVLLNIELKSVGSGIIVTRILKNRIKKPGEWDNVIVSSFLWSELVAARHQSKAVNLALLESINPFSFLVLHRKLDLTAVGFHRLHTNRFALEIARRLKIFTYVYTVNRLDTAKKFATKDVDGIVTDYPDRLIAAFERPDKKR